ncbi:MAG: diversity-generating retroelement protein Avd [Candidatus Omnitrophica bacterium]|nr:diversity-generating retroelement protein Avd [Candidatus Omnitrophota bacterium]
MTIKEILEIENNNNDSIVLLKEGMFFRAYNQSAMRLSTQIKKFKINVKLIKYLQKTIFYCGFPQSILPQIKDMCLAKSYQPMDHRVGGPSVAGAVIFASDVSHGLNFDSWTKEILKEIAVTGGVKKAKQLTPSVTPVVEKHYDLIMWFLPKLANFPKDQRFLLADRIEGMLLDILGMLIEAVFANEREEILKKANLKIDQLRYLVRITKDMKYISLSQYDFFSLKIIEIGRMVGGWKKAAIEKTREPAFTDVGSGKV